MSYLPNSFPGGQPPANPPGGWGYRGPMPTWGVGNTPNINVYTPPTINNITINERPRTSFADHLATFLGGLLLWKIGREMSAASKQATFTPRSAPIMATSYDNPAPPRSAAQPTRPFVAVNDDVSTPPPGGPARAFGDGVFVVGLDIEPGIYRAQGDHRGKVYWARLRNLRGESASIIANAFNDGMATVEILSTDVAFESRQSGGWRRIHLPQEEQ